MSNTQPISSGITSNKLDISVSSNPKIQTVQQTDQQTVQQANQQNNQQTNQQANQQNNQQLSQLQSQLLSQTNIEPPLISKYKASTYLSKYLEIFGVATTDDYNSITCVNKVMLELLNRIKNKVSVSKTSQLSNNLNYNQRSGNQRSVNQILGDNELLLDPSQYLYFQKYLRIQKESSNIVNILITKYNDDLSKLQLSIKNYSSNKTYITNLKKQIDEIIKKHKEYINTGFNPDHIFNYNTDISSIISSVKETNKRHNSHNNYHNSHYYYHNSHGHHSGGSNNKKLNNIQEINEMQKYLSILKEENMNTIDNTNKTNIEEQVGGSSNQYMTTQKQFDKKRKEMNEAIVNKQYATAVLAYLTKILLTASNGAKKRFLFDLGGKSKTKKDIINTKIQLLLDYIKYNSDDNENNESDSDDSSSDFVNKKIQKIPNTQSSNTQSSNSLNNVSFDINKVNIAPVKTPPVFSINIAGAPVLHSDLDYFKKYMSLHHNGLTKS